MSGTGGRDETKENESVEGWRWRNFKWKMSNQVHKTDIMESQRDCKSQRRLYKHQGTVGNGVFLQLCIIYIKMLMIVGLDFSTLTLQWSTVLTQAGAHSYRNDGLVLCGLCKRLLWPHWSPREQHFSRFQVIVIHWPSAPIFILSMTYQNLQPTEESVTHKYQRTMRKESFATKSFLFSHIQSWRVLLNSVFSTSPSHGDLNLWEGGRQNTLTWI